jgi:2'-hydroxyisoflavone reductase
MKNLLIIGGTNFIGRNLLNELSSQTQYKITLFNRGITNPDAFPEIPRIIGDRNTNDVAQLNQQKWDLVIDLSCYFPNSLEQILKHIGEVERYIFVSTCSVYDSENLTILKNENAPLLSCSEEQKIDTTPSTYGQRKVACEAILEQSNLDYLILRPALVYGKYDNTDRLYYWLEQVEKSRPLLLPNGGKSVFSVTYVKDLVHVLVECLTIEMPQERTFNVTTTTQTSILQIVDAACESLKKEPKRWEVTPAFLHQNEVGQWMDMPLWLDGDHFTWSNERLKDTFKTPLTPFKESIEATIAFYKKNNYSKPIYGMSNDRKNKLIKIIEKSI